MDDHLLILVCVVETIRGFDERLRIIGIDTDLPERLHRMEQLLAGCAWDVQSQYFSSQRFVFIAFSLMVRRPRTGVHRLGMCAPRSSALTSIVVPWLVLPRLASAARAAFAERAPRLTLKRRGVLFCTEFLSVSPRSRRHAPSHLAPLSFVRQSQQLTIEELTIDIANAC